MFMHPINKYFFKDTINSDERLSRYFYLSLKLTRRNVKKVE